jgi:hypothetical protein
MPGERTVQAMKLMDLQRFDWRERREVSGSGEKI